MTTGRVVCAMYTGSESIRQAWQLIFSLLPPALFNRQNLILQTENTDIGNPDVVLAHTCGYPLIKTWQVTHEPVCVPVFSVDGSDNRGRYQSFFVASKNRIGSSLADFKNQAVAINAMDSNSGMNVLRYAISQLETQSRFFAKTIISGSHANSIESVMSNTADIAAVDAVTYHILTRENADIRQQTTVIGRSVMTAGLPFITRKTAQIDKDKITKALNEIIQRPEVNAVAGFITGFRSITITDYQQILQLEHDADERGYAILQ